ncbi:hypothetical protein AVEN_252933-1 [Araneus ventricosus]|uniref:Uncharacterized protein n=1 Tax=Araneus ventricosus TaxID=182803 RepID=A0A4Y2FER9_ARAVE|nr:hypothetical protein AVEN_252933-1 [Araneus ventricosus]
MTVRAERSNTRLEKVPANCTLKQLDMRIKNLIFAYLSIHSCTGNHGGTMIPPSLYLFLSRIFPRPLRVFSSLQIEITLQTDIGLINKENLSPIRGTSITIISIPFQLGAFRSPN